MDRRQKVIMHWNLKRISPQQSVAAEMRRSPHLPEWKVCPGCKSIHLFIHVAPRTARSSRKEKTDLEDKNKCIYLATNWTYSSTCWTPCGAIFLICNGTYLKTFFNCRGIVCETEAGELCHALFLETFLLLRSKEKLKCFIIFLSFSYAGIS